MISNKSNLRNFVKSKRNGNNKLFIRKNDDFDFLREDLFSITNIKNATPKFFSIVSLSSSNIFFTDKSHPRVQNKYKTNVVFNFLIGLAEILK